MGVLTSLLGTLEEPSVDEWCRYGNREFSMPLFIIHSNQSLIFPGIGDAGLSKFLGIEK